MRRFTSAILVGLVIASGGCETLEYMYTPPAPPPPRPLRGAGPVDWRSLLGCWRVENGTFVFDSAPAHARPGAVDARWAEWLPRRERRGPGVSYWWVTPRNSVEFVRDDGLHGRIYELVVRGDRLVGRIHTLTDIVGAYPPAVRTSAERVPCPTDFAAAP